MYAIIQKSRATIAFILLLLPSFISNATTSGISNDVIKYNTEHHYTSNELAAEDITILSSIPKGLPVQKHLIRCAIPSCSGFGYRMHPILGSRKLHAGIDLPAERGTLIKSTHYGRVHKVVHGHPGYGNYVVIISDNYETKYAHCDSILVKEGERVSMGQNIATVGNTGLSTAPHCHYEILKNGVAINPFSFI